MSQRYLHIAQLNGLDFFDVNLQNNFSSNPIINIYHRLLTKSKIKTRFVALETYLRMNTYETIYLSSAEGYVSKNIIYNLKKSFPLIRMIALQHGIFPLKSNIIKSNLINGFNNLCYSLMDIYPLGSGFGGIKTDEYYVYSEREREFLVKSKGWNKKQVFIRLDFIKAELYNSYKNGNFKQHQDYAFFLLQGLSHGGICTKKQEGYLIEKSITYLSRKFSKLLIKEHPACADRLENMRLPKNVEKVTTMIEGFERCTNAYSFFSTGLVDAKVYRMNTFGIYSKMLKVDKGIYDNFDVKINFEGTIDT